jgi:hypothetical protein
MIFSMFHWIRKGRVPLGANIYKDVNGLGIEQETS